MRHVVRAIALVPLFAALATWCAQERAPINRVQAHALARSFFVGRSPKGLLHCRQSCSGTSTCPPTDRIAAMSG